MRVVPWVILLGALAWLALLSLPQGPILLIVLVPGWLIVVALERRVVDRMGTRPPRLAADVALAGLCFLFLSFDGLWVLPAVVAFGVVDLVAGGAGGPRSVLA